MKIVASRRTIRYGVIVVVALALGGPMRSTIAEEKPADAGSKGPAFDSFHILLDRNIFSAKRVPKTANGDKAKDPAPPPPSHTVRLMGTYLTDERSLALFEGTEDIPGGGLKLGESIAGYRIEEVRVDAAVLANDQGKIEVPVGSGLTKGEKDQWTVTDKPVIDRPKAATTDNAAPKSSDAAPAATGSLAEKTASDALEKLRARRRKELGQ